MSVVYEWVQLSPTHQPAPRRRHDMAWDSAHNKIVLTGGEFFTNSPTAQESWGWDGTDWGGAVASPTDRTLSLMIGRSVAYDAPRGELVAFGGLDSSSVKNNHTWVSGDGGATWTLKSPAHSPTARAGAGLAYCAAIGKVVLFGGFINGGTGLSNQTWTWDGVDWTQQSPAHVPPARWGGHSNFATEYLSRVLIFGGEGPSFSAGLNDTWIYDGADWLEQSPTSVPSARDQHAMAFYAKVGRVVLFGGETVPGGTLLADTWTFRDGQWHQETPLASPAARFGLALSEDGNLNTVILFGGDTGGVSDEHNDTWRLDVTPILGVYSAPITVPLGNVPAHI